MAGWGFSRFWWCGLIVLAALAVGTRPAEAATDDFVSTWRTTTANERITLPLYVTGEYDFRVEWGDGSIDTIKTPAAAHDYVTPGDHVVTISGTLKGWSFSGGGNRLKIVRISNWGDLNFGNFGGAFQGASNLECDATDAPDLTGVTTLKWTFYGASKFNCPLNSWDVSNVTNLFGMFQEATTFNQDLDQWDTGNVLGMSQVFQGASAFNGNISTWDTSEVQDFAATFQGATAFNQPIGGWDVASAIEMVGMFHAASSFNHPLDGWNVSGLQHMNMMFWLASSFDQDLGAWDIHSVAPGTVNYMLSGSGMSPATYGSTLIGWASNGHAPDHLGIESFGIKYACAAVSARQRLMWDYGWTFSGDLPTTTDCLETTWDIPATDPTITLPLQAGGTYNFGIDWGDGASTVITKPADATHIYTAGGQKTIKISGTLNGWAFNNTGDKDKLTKVVDWGNLEVGTAAFHGASNLQSLPTAAPRLTNDLSDAFREAAQLNADLSGWDVSSVTSMANMLDGTALSQDNYNATLIGWAAQGVQSNVTLGARGLRYSCPAMDARRTLTDQQWTITDAGNGCFITTWHTDTAGETVSLPLTATGSYDFTVDWGDGSTPQHITGASASHPSANVGDHELRIWGTLRGWSFREGGNPLQITNVSHWGDVNFGGPGAFENASNLTCTASDAPDLTGVTDLSATFHDAAKFDCPLNGWVVSDVTDMQYMFAGASAFDQDLSGWNTANLTNANGMFAAADAFNGDISTWDTKNVTSMVAMFREAKAFNRDISAWDTGRVTDFTLMFQFATTFDQDIGGWDTGSATNMTGMFSHTANFNQDLNHWDTSQVTTMEAMFAASAFNGQIGTWDTANVTDMTQMFQQAADFNQDISDWDTGRVQRMPAMFAWAEVFNQDLGDWDTSQVTRMDGMFANTAFTQDIGAWDTGNVTRMDDMFSRAQDFNQDISGWDVSAVEQMEWMFDEASRFNQDLRTWNPSHVTTMQNMFYGAEAFDQSLGSWNIGQVTNMAGMLVDSGISTANYDATLAGWASQTVQADVPLDASQMYSCPTQAARDSLTSRGWNITDSGKASCTVLQPGTATFAAQEVGVPSPAATVTLRNAGDHPLLIASTEIIGPDRAMFSATTNCSNLTPGATCAFAVTFTPSSNGQKAATLLLRSDAGSGPDSVTLTGTGISPAMSVTPTTLDLGRVRVGQRATARELRVANTGTKPFTVTAVEAPADFPVTGVCGQLQPGQSCLLAASFSPSRAGPSTGQVTIRTDASFGDRAVAVSGVGVKARQHLRLRLPKRIKLNGVTLITPSGTRTDAGLLVRTRITGGPTAPSAAGETRYFSVLRGPDGKTSVRTYGHADLRLIVKQRARETAAYEPWERTVLYANGRR